MHDLDGGMFREQAIDHYLSSEERGQVIRITPPRRMALILLVVAAVVVGLLYVLLSTVAGHALF